MLFLETQREERLYLPPPCPPITCDVQPPFSLPHHLCFCSRATKRLSSATCLWSAHMLSTCRPSRTLVPCSWFLSLWVGEGEAVMLPKGRLSSRGCSPLLFQYLMWILRKPTCIQQHLGISVHDSEIWSSRMCTAANPSPQIDNLVDSMVKQVVQCIVHQ